MNVLTLYDLFLSFVYDLLLLAKDLFLIFDLSIASVSTPDFSTSLGEHSYFHWSSLLLHDC